MYEKRTNLVVILVVRTKDVRDVIPSFPNCGGPRSTLLGDGRASRPKLARLCLCLPP